MSTHGVPHERTLSPSPRTLHPVTDQYEQFQYALLEWSQGNLREFPWRQTTNPYEVLVAEILLQRTPAERVEPIYEQVIAAYPELHSMADADVARLAEMLQTLGFQNQRAQALVTIGSQLADSGVPEDEAALLELPYVGKYAANATLCFAFSQPRAIVDANVVRVYERMFDKQFGATDTEAWHLAQSLLPDDDVQRFNLALLDFAAAVCKPGTPDCGSCFFRHQCDFPEE